VSDPILILGCHRSGTSVVAGLLHDACGVTMGELLPPTADNPMGYYESHGVVSAHRDLLFQMERDWTCPPTSFRPGLLDLTMLEEQIELHRQLPGVWAMKDPRSIFMLRAWAHLGVDQVRLVGVARAPADTVRSIEKRDGIRQDRAEAIVDTYLRRLVEIARQVDLPVVCFSNDGVDVLRQVRELAASLELDWDEGAAESFFDSTLVRNQSPLRDSTPTYDALLAKAIDPASKRVPSVSLSSLRLKSEPAWPLETHLGVRHGQQRHELWKLAHFSSVPDPEVAEILLDGARPGGGRRPVVRELHQIEVASPLAVGAALMQRRLRPHGVIAHGILAGRSHSEIEFCLRSIYINTHALAELVVDVPAPRGGGLLNVVPPPVNHPRPASVQEIAERCGWDHVVSERVSAGRMGMVFRKRVLTDGELIPVVTDLIASIDRIHSIDTRLAALEGRLGGDRPAATIDESRALRAERRRAEAAERDLQRLRNRRSVKLALAMAKPFARVFHVVRTWKKSR
jgi:hypothetical protein